MPEPVAAGLSPSPSPETPPASQRLSPPEGGRACKAFQWLDHFCLLSGFDAVRADPLPAQDLPPPYRALLAHSRDMTSTLEQHYGQKTALLALRREQGKKCYSREVLLTTPGHGPVEYGLIQMDLTWFPARVRERILQEQLPLGRLLQDHAIPYLCWPQGFFRFAPNGYLRAVLGLPAPATLYGRRNFIVNAARRLLADVLEILAPAPNVTPTPSINRAHPQ